MTARVALAALLLLAVAPAATAHGAAAGYGTTSCDALSGPLPGSGRVLRTGAGQRFTTIQSAVDHAREGDTVLISPGVYREAVKVRTPGLRIRGTSRSGVVLDGGLARRTGLFVTADRVVVENLSARGYLDGPVLFSDVTGYWASHLTLYASRLAGLALESRCGQVDDVFASGNGLSGFATIACHPCDAMYTRMVVENTNLGLAALDVGGNFTVQDSISRRNHLGVAFANADHEGPPPTGALIRRNLVVDNNNRAAPAVEAPAVGVGMMFLGGHRHRVEANDVREHEIVGIALSGNPAIPEHPPTGNAFRGNHVTGSGMVDLVQDTLTGSGNCWSGNRYDSALPVGLETLWSCSLPTTPPGGAPAFAAFFVPESSPGGDWRTWPAPEDPAAWRDQPDDDGDGRYADDDAVDSWLPELPRVAHPPRTSPAPGATAPTGDEIAHRILAPLKAAAAGE